MKNADKPINPYMYNGVVQREKTVDWDNDILYGLTKREHFAAMAMQGLCANPKYAGSLNATMVSCAISLADELLNQLEEQ